MIINFTVRGIPKGQPRPRAFARGGKVRMYDAGTAEAWKGAIALAAKPHLPALPLDKPIKLTIEHYMPRPKNHYGTGKNAGAIKFGAPTLHTSKPDIDNLCKSVLDSLTQLGVWLDDDQVYFIEASKIYGSPTGAIIKIETFNPL